MKSNATPEAHVFRVNMARALINDIKELSQRIGIEDQRLRKRFVNPSMMRLYEFRAIINETGMPDEDILKIVKGGKEC